MKRLFVINPSAGGGSARRLAGWERYFRRSLGEFPYVLTRDRADIERQTRIALQDGVEQIVAVGGDGTVNSVANGFFENGRPVSPRARLAVARAGSGSDYYRTLVGRSRRPWWEIVGEHAVRPVDLGRITFSDGRSFFFLNMATFGLAAEVVKAKARLPGLVPNALGYLLPTLGQVFSYAPQPLELRLDEQLVEGDILALFVAKGQFAGGGMRLGGEVTLHDGKLGVTLVRGMGLAERLRRLPQLYLGLETGPSIIKTTARRISARAPRPIAVETDGEPMGTTDVELDVVPGVLNLCFPVEKTP